MIQGVTTGAGGGALGAHLADLKGQNELTRPGSSRGLLSESTQDQIRELSQLAGASRAQKPIAHFHADPPADAKWGEREWASHWERLEREFGLQSQPYAEAIHEKAGREHRHRVYSLYDEKTGKTLRLDHSYARLEKLSRLAEFETGHAFTQGRHNRAVVQALRADGRDDVAKAIESSGFTDGPRPSAITPKERHQEERTAISKQDVAKLTATAWSASDSPQAFISALRESGLALAVGDKTTLVVDQSGNTHSLTRMLAMSARANGEPAPKAADIHARLAGIELPSLDEARQQVGQVPDPVQVAPTPQPDPVPPGSGVHVAEVVPSSQDVSTPSHTATSTGGEKNAPAHAHAHAQGGLSTSQRAPKGAGGGGGALAPSQDASTPLPSLDVGAGPGEPPPHNATPQQKAEYAAKLAAYEDRKAKAWLSWLKAWESQAKSKRNPKILGGGSSDVHDEKELRRVASDLIREIQSAAEKSAAIRAFNQAFEQFTAFRNDENRPSKLDSERERAPSPDGARSEGNGHSRRDELPPRDGRAIADARAHRRDSDDGRIAFKDREKSERNPLNARAESLVLGRLAALSDFSRLRAAMSDLSPQPDLLEGLGPKERKAKLQEFREELLALYRQDRDVIREDGRADWREKLAAEKVRSSPLAHELRTNWKHLSPAQREAGWTAIREARESLISEMKATAKANPPDDFRSWLEFVSQTDSRARAVVTAMKEAEANKAKIDHELALGDERLKALKATAPKGERDEEKAARTIKEQMKSEHASREADALEARKEADLAAARVRWWHFGTNHPLKLAARKAEKNAQQMEWVRDTRAPSKSDFHEAMETARSRARSNLRAFQSWENGPKGTESKALERSLSGIRHALAGKDFYMRSAILEGGIDAALEEQRRREALEAKRREIEQRKAERKQDLETGKVVQFPSPSGPRMR
jgi:hypothetical protein